MSFSAACLAVPPAAPKVEGFSPCNVDTFPTFGPIKRFL
jgi:hypothetical protein